MEFDVTTCLVKRVKSYTKIEDMVLKLKRFMLKILNLKETKYMNIKEERFKNFSRSYLNESDFILETPKDLKIISEKYNYFVIGSDQVWNPANVYGTNFYFSPNQYEKSYQQDKNIN